MALFDVQATTFDSRVGLLPECQEQIADAILDIAALCAGDLLVEVGAGTGQIGALLAQSSVRYLGFDVSEAMLSVFRQRLQAIAVPAEVGGTASNWTLLQADGNQRWPIADDSARAIFSSRAMHLLDCDRVIDESFRIAHPEGATLMIGRVQRSPNSLKARMQQQLQSLLTEHGLQGRDGKQTKRQLLNRCCERGATAIDPVVVTHWSVEHAPRHSLENWHNKSGLGGVATIPETVKDNVLTTLATWAADRFGDLDRPIVTEEAYVIDAVRLPANPAQ